MSQQDYHSGKLKAAEMSGRDGEFMRLKTQLDKAKGQLATLKETLLTNQRSLYVKISTFDDGVVKTALEDVEDKAWDLVDRITDNQVSISLLEKDLHFTRTRIQNGGDDEKVQLLHEKLGEFPNAVPNSASSDEPTSRLFGPALQDPSSNAKKGRFFAVEVKEFIDAYIEKNGEFSIVSFCPAFFQSRPTTFPGLDPQDMCPVGDGAIREEFVRQTADCMDPLTETGKQVLSMYPGSQDVGAEMREEKGTPFGADLDDTEDWS